MGVGLSTLNRWVKMVADDAGPPDPDQNLLRENERLAEAEINLSVRTVGDSHGNALAEDVIGLFKTKVINQIGPWKSMREVDWETLKSVDWYNNRRILGPRAGCTQSDSD